MPESCSLANSIALLPAQQRHQLISELTPEQAEDLLYDWKFWARPNQLPPIGQWRVWLILAGRGWGKTRTGAEFVIDQVRAGKARRVALIGPTAADVRDVMVEGESGILACSPPDFMPLYEPSKRRLTWPNGAIATLYSGEEPDRLRGPQHDLIWADEPAAWKYVETWDMAMFGLRLGEDPRVVATTTPRPIPLIKELLKDPTTAPTRGSTYENQDNLAPAFLEKIVRKYEGTRLGRQELNAEILDDNPGALWQRDCIENLRIKRADLPDIVRIFEGVDPAVTSGEESAETGIIIVGESLPINGVVHYYVLADYSIQGSPHQWALAVSNGYYDYFVDRVIGEQNNGGELVEVNLRTIDENISYSGVYASRGKRTRAEPISALYEQGRVHHVGTFPQLEDQLCEWVPGDKSPDRLDALVWAISKMIEREEREETVTVLDDDSDYGGISPV